MIGAFESETAIELIKQGAAVIFVMLAIITDYRKYRIKNKSVLVFLLMGLVINGTTAWPIGLLDSALGMLVPLVLFPLFALKMLGAGDIKAFCAIGALVGLRMSVYTVLFAFVAGGVIAAGFMVFRKNAVERMKQFGRYMMQCFCFGKLLPYDDFADENSRFRFSLGIACGLALAIAERYFY
jgi:prepilin peptidase CpaA